MRLGLQFAIAAIGLALLVLGAWAMHAEGDAFVDGSDSNVARIVDWATSPAEAGWSITAQNANLLDCAGALQSPDALLLRYLDQPTRAAVAPTCLALANRITGGAPAASYGWYVGAMALAATDDFPAMNAWLLRSQITGPNERWIAELRVALAETHHDALLPATAAAHQADLRLLIMSESGIASIAARYRSDAAFRDRVLRVVETLPHDFQRDFLDQARAGVLDPR